jgi:hypothetical protein
VGTPQNAPHNSAHYQVHAHFFGARRTENVQKLVSNMIIRASSSIALQCASDSDCRLYGPLGPCATPTTPGQVPLLGPIDLHCSTVHTGTFLLQPVAFLATGSMPRVHECSRTASTLPELFAELQAGETVYGALVPWGAFNLSTLLPQRYVQQHMLYDAAARKRLATYESTNHSDVDTITALLQVRVCKD